MIENDREYELTRNALMDMENALNALRKNVYFKNPELYELMASDYVKTINELRLEIDTYFNFGSIQDNSVPIWVRAVGFEINLWNSPSSVWASLLDRIRKTVTNVTKILMEDTRYFNPEITDLKVIAFQQGSLKIGLEIPKANPFKNITLSDTKIVHEAVDKIFNSLSWITNNDVYIPKLNSYYDNIQQRNKILNEITTLVPSKDGIDFIEYSGNLVSNHEPIKVNYEVKEVINKVIAKTIEDKDVEIEGTIRELDLDRQRCILRNPDNNSEIRCIINALILNTAKNAFDRRVKVTGIFKKGKEPLIIRSIRIIS